MGPRSRPFHGDVDRRPCSILNLSRFAAHGAQYKYAAPESFELLSARSPSTPLALLSSPLAPTASAWPVPHIENVMPKLSPLAGFGDLTTERRVHVALL